MRRLHTVGTAWAGALIVLLTGCGGPDAPPPPDAPEPAAYAGRKVPITTRSDDALDLYLEGRKLTDRLRNSEARRLYLEALKEDRHFALAHLAIAGSSTSAREFFEAMERARALSDVVSEGERLMILAMDAGVRGEANEQLEALERLAALYPDDERAHSALGVVRNARQEYDAAIAAFERAVEIDPEFSPPYNQLGYLYRSLGKYEEAEGAFRRYIELIPDEPNPYDSYAELLMKIGRFEESIANYERALEIKPDFFFSMIGIGNNLVFLGRGEEARDVFGRMEAMAPDVGQQRTAILWRALSWVHEDRLDRALEAAGEMFQLAEANDDPASMADDRILMGQILLSSGDEEQALERFSDAVTLLDTAGVPEDVRENARRNFLYWKARAEISRNRLSDARSALDDYRTQVEGRESPFERRRLHAVEGELALAEGEPTRALEHLAQSNQQSPRILYLTALAQRAAGNLEAARRSASRAAEFNGLSVDYAFVRRAAEELLAELGAV